MLRMNSPALLSLLALSMIAGVAFAQEPPTLLVVPSKSTMLVGDTRTFRAVGKDGRTSHNVRWSVSPEHAATLTTDGDEATLNAKEPFSTLVLTAYASGDSSEAIIEIHSGASLAAGTPIWSVTNLPGCKSVKITQAVPTASGPDLYLEESCLQGTFIRAMTADGREIWRRRIGDWAAPPPLSIKTQEQARPGQHLNLNGHSLCDDISYGMSKEAVSNLAQDRDLRLGEKQWENNTWEIEEYGFRCNVLFDAAQAVVKKTKVIITE